MALETLKIYEERDIVGHVCRVAVPFQVRLAALLDHPLVGQTRGVGLLGVVELGLSKERKSPFDPKLKLGAFVAERALAHGVILRNLGDTIAICPPLIITESEIDELFEGLGRALNETVAHARDSGALPKAA